MLVHDTSSDATAESAVTTIAEFLETFRGRTPPEEEYYSRPLIMAKLILGGTLTKRESWIASLPVVTAKRRGRHLVLNCPRCLRDDKPRHAVHRGDCEPECRCPVHDNPRARFCRCGKGVNDGPRGSYCAHYEHYYVEEV